MKLKLKFKIKSYHIENMGGGTLAYFGQFKNGLYFAGNETDIFNIFIKRLDKIKL